MEVCSFLKRKWGEGVLNLGKRRIGEMGGVAIEKSIGRKSLNRKRKYAGIRVQEF